MTHEASRRRVTYILLALSVSVSLIFLVFAFIQKTEADKQRGLAVVNRMEAGHQRLIAEQVRIELEKAKQELKTCRGN